MRAFFATAAALLITLSVFACDKARDGQRSSPPGSFAVEAPAATVPPAEVAPVPLSALEVEATLPPMREPASEQVEMTATPLPPLRPDAAAAQAPPPGPSPAVSPVIPLIERVSGQNPQWVSINAPDAKTILAAVAWPEGPGPFPAVVLLHGTSGFKQEDVRLVQDLARQGFIAAAVCWFAGNPGASTPPDRIDCPNGPVYKGVSAAAVADVAAAVEGVRRMQGVRPDRIGLWGQSRGATMALVVASRDASLAAVVATSAAYTQLGGSGPGCIGCIGAPELVPLPLIANLRVPVLMLHAVEDATVPVQQARRYETALREAGKTYEVHYYEGAMATHSFAYNPPSLRTDALQRAITFFRRHLGQ